MGVLTNGQRSLTSYRVADGPKTGQIFISDAPASVFSQVNIDNEEVVFMQSNMSSPDDSFVCTITNQDVVLEEQRFLIRVAPLLTNMEVFVAHMETKYDSTPFSKLQGTNLTIC